MFPNRLPRIVTLQDNTTLQLSTIVGTCGHTDLCPVYLTHVKSSATSGPSDKALMPQGPGGSTSRSHLHVDAAIASMQIVVLVHDFATHPEFALQTPRGYLRIAHLAAYHRVLWNSHTSVWLYCALATNVLASAISEIASVTRQFPENDFPRNGPVLPRMRVQAVKRVQLSNPPVGCTGLNLFHIEHAQTAKYDVPRDTRVI